MLFRQLDSRMSSIAFRTQGFSFVGTLVLAAAVSVICLAIIAIVQQTRAPLKHLSTLRALDVTRTNIVTLVLDPGSWEKTVEANSAGGPFSNGGMDCIKFTRPCTTDGTIGGPPIKGRRFAIIDASGKLFLDATRSTNGTTTTGHPCDSFAMRSNGGKNNCVFRYDITWSANCTPGNCVSPQIKVSAQLNIDSAALGIVVNPAPYSIPSVFRSP